MPKHTITIKDGIVKFIYDDSLLPLLSLGKSTVTRASNVEPGLVDGSIMWYADMKLSGGPKLGPFSERKEAINAEIEWLNAKLIGK